MGALMKVNVDSVIEGVFSKLTRKSAAARARTQRRHLGDLVRVDDGALAYSRGAKSDLYLLLGGDLTVSWGVRQQRLSFAGALSRALSIQSGNGTEIAVATCRNLKTATVTGLLKSLNVGRFDKVIISLDFIDLLAFPSRRSLESAFDEIISFLQNNCAANVTIFVIGPTVVAPAKTRFPCLGFSTRLQKNVLATTLERLCASRDRVVFLRVASVISIRRDASENARTYRGAADHVAAAMVAALSLLAPLVPTRADASLLALAKGKRFRQLETRISRAPYSSPSEARVDHIVDLARELVGSQSATFSTVDGDRFWLRSSVGVGEREKTQSGSLCSLVVQQNGRVVVVDTQSDVRFGENRKFPSSLDIRFYAGIPVRDSTGHLVGVLCVFDSTPRAISELTLMLLCELGGLLQREMRSTAIVAA